MPKYAEMSGSIQVNLSALLEEARKAPQPTVEKQDDKKLPDESHDQKSGRPDRAAN